MTYNLRVKIFRGRCFDMETFINAWLDSYAKDYGGAPIITNILQTEADTDTLTISIFYNHGCSQGE